jgi:hypothetical protein
VAFLAAKGAGAKSQKQAQGAADRARLQANRTPEATTEFPGNKLGEVSFTRPRDRNEETVAQGTFVGGLTGAALRHVRRHAANIAWMRSTMSPTSRVQLVQNDRQKKQQVPGGEGSGWWTQPESPTLPTREDCRSFLEDPGSWGLLTENAAHAAAPTSSHMGVRTEAGSGHRAPKEDRRTTLVEET